MVNVLHVSRLLVGLLLFVQSISFAETSRHEVELKAAQQALSEQRYDEAYQAYLVLAERDEPLAYFNLGLFYSYGWGIAPDALRACQWFEKAAVLNIPTAQQFVGDCIISYDWFPQKRVKPGYWYKLAYANGIYDAGCSYGKLLLGSRWYKQDITAAINWCTEAALKSSVSAQYTLGEIYAEPIYGVHDLEAARHWFQLAMSNGHGMSAFKLAKIYLVVESDKDNVHEYRQHALALMEKAANMGVVNAYKEVAKMYWHQLSQAKEERDSLLAKAYLWAKVTAIVMPQLNENKQLLRRVLEVMPTQWQAELDAEVNRFIEDQESAL